MAPPLAGCGLWTYCHKANRDFEASEQAVPDDIPRCVARNLVIHSRFSDIIEST
jgi:hypothetical protein